MIFPMNEEEQCQSTMIPNRRPKFLRRIDRLKITATTSNRFTETVFRAENETREGGNKMMEDSG